MILTPNRRLAASLHKRYQRIQEATQTCWPTPEILPLISWIQKLWADDEYQEETPYLLNQTQEQYIWEQILLRSKASSQLLQITETADLAKSGWGLLKQWCLDTDLEIFQTSEDYQALYHWAEDFKKTCAERNWVDSNTIPNLIIKKIISRKIELPKKITLVGFTEISPQIKLLLTHCEENGCEVLHFRNSLDALFASEPTHCHSSRITANNDDEEILTMARWAKSVYFSDDQALIGCVIPNLDKIRDRVIQIFQDVFDTAQDAFNISAGKRLSDFPVIYAALTLLNLHKKQINRETFSYLLITPFLGASEKERYKRAYTDRLVRQSNISRIELEKENAFLSNCPKLIKLIQTYLQLVDQFNDKASFHTWSERISALLIALGWPGERSLNSEEYQTVEAWKNALNELSSLDYVAKPVDLQSALLALKRIVTNSIFQPKTADARVQVLGMLEAAGSPFDYLWISGMDDLAWPPQPKPHPFIPKQLQRELNMPHATAERELMFCNELTKQFQDNAKRVIYSYAKENNELERQISPLLRHLPDINIDSLALDSYDTPCHRVFQSKQIEAFIDHQAPSLVEGEKVHGGMSIIKKQAMCAFKAFAEHRLFAQELESPLLGLRKKDRGELLHKVMEMIWNKTKDQTALLQLSEEALDALINESIESAVQLIPSSHANYPNYIRLEKQRMYKLAHQWLALEKQRPFFKVLNNEEKSTIKLNKLTLTIRIDRIDELSDGKKLIIDYKTGKDNHPNSWLSDRPDEPQLPLYALIEEDQTIGIAFAQLHPEKYLFAGLSQYDLDIKGIKPFNEWNDQLVKWRSVLNQLSDDFYSGQAVVNPKEQEKTCEWCALEPLCRIKEVSLHE